MSPVLNKNLKIKIGTRGSQLALTQAYYIKDLLKNIACLTDDHFEIIPIVTTGDRFLSAKLQEFGGKGLFTKEIEQALLMKTIDIAVHSAKDVPTYRQEHLVLVSTPKREDPLDAFISEKYTTFNDLPEQASIGTASLRRTAQALNLRPDLNIQLLRGNVQTRLKKIQDNKYDATFLACAGIKRLGLMQQIRHVLTEDCFLPAPAQGALLLEIHKDCNPEIKTLLQLINCQDTFDCITAERAYLSALDGNCRMALAALAKIQDHGKLMLTAELLSDDGKRKVRQQYTEDRSDSFKIGAKLGQSIKQEFYSYDR